MTRRYEIECALAYRERPNLRMQREIERIVDPLYFHFGPTDAVLGANRVLSAGVTERKAHDEIAAAIRRILPDATVTTKWYGTESFREWDHVFTSEESRGEACER